MSIFSSRDKRIEALEKKIELYKSIEEIYKQHLQEMNEQAEKYKQDGEKEVYDLWLLEIGRYTHEYGDCLQAQVNIYLKITRLYHYPSWLVWW